MRLLKRILEKVADRGQDSATRTPDETISPPDGTDEPTSTRRGIFAATAALAALAGFRSTPASATANVTVNTASTADIGLLASTGASGSPIQPTITGSTTYSIIGSQSSLAELDMDSGVAGARSGSGRTGVLGVNPSSGFGVVGKAADGIGVAGESTSNFGVSGTSDSGVAVSGVSNTGSGVLGQSTSAIGVRGISSTNFGIRGDSQKQSGVIAGTPAPGVAALTARSSAPTRPTAGRFVGAVRVEGDFAVTGVKAAAVPLPDGSLVTMYCQESPEPYFEDFGSARLQEGAVKVPIDPAFAALVRPEQVMIFLTPEGNCRGLYVHAKGPDGFEVRELMDGSASVDFSWRIVARRGDIVGARLAPVDALEPLVLSEMDEPLDVHAELAAASTRDPSRLEA